MNPVIFQTMNDILFFSRGALALLIKCAFLKGFFAEALM